ncbi:kinesin-like protein Klp8 [Ptychographa xylographoides]|nr:kinesin-like protein Klp8 [Ptychographa xylographoides]
MAGGNIKVVVRVRPFNSRETDRRAKCIVQMKDSQTILHPPPDAEERLRSTKGGKVVEGQKVFAFDKSYWSFDRGDPHYAGQDSLFTDLGSPLLDNAFQGYNNCIFAYGQTGSGKSYSMMGYGEEAGVIPQICRDMFERITSIQEDKNLNCTVEVSYLEIYNERVRDLLNPTTKGNLKVREHPATGPYVEDLAKLVVRSFKEIESLMDEGNKARTVAATNMNETSSRSHAVFTLTLTQKRHDVETSMDTEKVAKISLVDLAGSERATSTGATGARLKEGAEINRSLSTLGRVIAALADLSTGKKRTASMVPYRDSVLTWLLKDSLGGNSMTAMIAAISPADINFEETLSTLRYADSAKRIKNHAVVNEDPNARMIRELKEELAQLRSKLSGGTASGGIAEEQYAPGTPLDKQIVSIIQADGTIKRVSKAEIVEQLNQSEKLYDDLNQTWEEKLQKTEQIHKEREAALEELGISIEKGFVGLSTPKKMPHLVNLSDDPLLTECLVYNLKPGSTTVGNAEDVGSTAEIRLNGSKILKHHCTFENTDNTVTIIPGDGAAVMINGLRIDKSQRLRSGSRLILGDFHIFRFNHPQEARAERAEQSLLRHSVTTRELGSPAPRPSHDRTLSRAISDVDGESSRAESPMPSNGRDSDWSFARREAANAILGTDQKINHLTDDQLDALFDDVQRARAERQGRPESRLFGLEDEDLESVSSYPVRDKYMSTGTIDNFSLDTALTFPSTPQLDSGEETQSSDERLRLVRDEMQAQLDKQKEDYQEQLRKAEASSEDFKELEVEKMRMEQALRAAKMELQAQLLEQKEAFEVQIEQMRKPPERKLDANGVPILTEADREYAVHAVERWRRLRNIALAEAILKHAALLKEAQVMGQVMDKSVVFQFTIVGRGQDMCSSYDLVLSDISGDEDEILQATIKPCVAVRVIDYQHSIVHLWSLEKLDQRVQSMRQMHQYFDRPDYMQHFGLENPFTESFLPQFTLIGDAIVPLTAVFEARVQDYAVEVISPHTQHAIGMVRLSIEPSSAQAPKSMLKFNVVMHDMTGFAEREGTQIHAQMFLPGISEEGGATTTQMISGFDEGPIRFESVHSMSLPMDSPPTALVHIAIYAKITSMHLDKLLSWDDIRESAIESAMAKKQGPNARIPEREFYVEEQHDVFAKLQILEMSEYGEYLPAEVEQSSNIDTGTYQLHQGLQRRIIVTFTHTSSNFLRWQHACSMRVGNIKLVDPWGKMPELFITADIPLKLVQTPSIKEEAGGTTYITMIGQWDSSLHDTVLLDRPTADRYSVQMSVSCDLMSGRTESLLTFGFEQKLQIRPRSWMRPQSMFKQLWKTTRIVHSTVGIFSIVLKPVPSKGANDLWRLNSQHHYVKGEEKLDHWSPRGISLIHDFMDAQRRRRRIAEVEAAKVSLARFNISRSNGASSSQLIDDNYTERQRTLLNRCLSLWKIPSLVSLGPSVLLTSPPPSPPRASPAPPKLIATTHIHTKNPTIFKSGPLLTPSPSSPAWLRRFAELRPPYLHLYSIPESEEINIINLRNATADAEPEVGRLLMSARIGGERRNVWAVYGMGGSWLFAVRDEAVKAEWILAIDRAFMRRSSDSGSGSASDDGR